jgi:hypothetical protein
MNYSGIDLHSNNSVVSVIDEADRVVAEKRLPNDLARILAFLAPWRAGLAGVVVESTFNWYWLVDGLQAAGFTVHLANTTAIRKYDGLKHSGDETDARYLAHLIIVDWPEATEIEWDAVPPSPMCSKADRRPQREPAVDWCQTCQRSTHPCRTSESGRTEPVRRHHQFREPSLVRSARRHPPTSPNHPPARAHARRQQRLNYRHRHKHHQPAGLRCLH